MVLPFPTFTVAAPTTLSEHVKIYASVVIPTCNPGDALVECVAAVYAQKPAGDGSIELIVVDNNSSADKHNYIRHVMALFHSPRIKQRLLVEQAQGAGHSRSRGIHEARAEFVGCLDDDNVVAPEWLIAGLDSLRCNHRIAAVTGLLLPPPWAPTESTFATCQEPFALRTAPTDRCFRYDTNRGHAPPSAGCVVRRSAVVSTILECPPLLLGLSRDFPLTSEDTELFMRLGQRGWEVWHNPGMVCTHSIAPERFTSARVRKLMRGIGLAHSPLRLVRTKSVLPWLLTMPLIMLRDLLQLVRETFALARDGGDAFRQAHAWRLFYAVQSPIRGNFHVIRSRLLGCGVSLTNGRWTEEPLGPQAVGENVSRGRDRNEPE